MTSVATTLAIIAPTKNPSSRLKITPQAEQRWFRLKGRFAIDASPQTGHCSFKERTSVMTIVRGSRFTLLTAHRLLTERSVLEHAKSIAHLIANVLSDDAVQIIFPGRVLIDEVIRGRLVTLILHI